MRERSLARIFDETFGVNGTFKAEFFVAPPHPVAMEFDLFGRGGVVIELRAAGQQKRKWWVKNIANCKSKIVPSEMKYKVASLLIANRRIEGLTSLSPSHNSIQSHPLADNNFSWQNAPRQRGSLSFY